MRQAQLAEVAAAAPHGSRALEHYRSDDKEDDMNEGTYTEWADQDDDAQAEDGERLPTDNTATFFGQC